MKKSNLILREILHKVYEKNENFMSQKSVAENCKTSSETVNRLVTKLNRIKAIEKKPQGFRVTKPQKILQYWAAIRDLHKDILWSTKSAYSMREIETELPKKSILTAYSGYRKKFRKKPFPYKKVYAYSDPKKVKKRFSESKKPGGNLIILKKDAHLEKVSNEQTPPLPQIYVDLWQIGTNSAERYQEKIEKELTPKPVELLRNLADKE